MSAGWWLILAFVFVALSSCCASISLALSTLSRAKLANAADEEPHEDKISRLTKIEKDPENHAAPVALLALVFQSLTILAMVFWASTMRHEESVSITSIVIGLLAGNVMLWILSTLIAFGVAKHNGGRTVVLFALPVRMLHAIFTPLMPISSFLSEVVRRLSDAAETPDDDQVNAHILSVVSESEREGHIDGTERDMLEAVVEFRSTLVESVMTPRTEIIAFEYADDIQSIHDFIDKNGHSRVPVYEDNLDHIRGMLYAKDLLRWINQQGSNGEPFVLADILRDPTFVPETKTVRELLSQLLADKVHIAMILDEYGGTSGLVTIEDIIEEIFGEIQDEYEDPENMPMGVQLDTQDLSAIIDARTEIDEANDELEALSIELPKSDDYDTVAGFVNTSFGRIPDVGEILNTDNVEIEILEAEPTRVTRLKMRLRPDDDEDTDPAPI